MGPKAPVAQSSELFRQPLCEMLNAKHSLVKLADVIVSDELERSFGVHLQATTGRVRESLMAAELAHAPALGSAAACRVMELWRDAPARTTRSPRRLCGGGSSPLRDGR